MQQYLTKLSTSPTEPVSLSDMLDWLKQAAGTDDAQVSGLITAARVYAETFQRRSLVSEQFQLQLQHFPLFGFRDGVDGYAGGGFYEDGYTDLWELDFGLYHPNARRFAIELPRGPLVTVDAFTYLDSTGTSQALASGAYQIIRGDGDMPQLFPADGTYWPTTLWDDPAAVSITFTAGFTAANIPQNTLIALKMLVTSWYEKRDGSQDIPTVVKTLLYQDRVFEF